jgi:hypothetical protein
LTLTDNSKALQLATQCWKQDKELKEKRICMKCGILENCTITKEYDRDGTTIKKYVLQAEYIYRENTLAEGETGVCRNCTDVYFKGGTPTKTTNRPEVQQIFTEINKTLAHDLFLLTSETDSESLPAFKKQLNRLQLEKKELDIRISKGLKLDKEQQTFLEEYNTKLQKLNSWIQSQEDMVKDLERKIDQMINQK